MAEKKVKRTTKTQKPKDDKWKKSDDDDLKSGVFWGTVRKPKGKK